MPSTDNTIARFFSWWKQGLRRPLETRIFKTNSNPMVLSVVETDLVDSQAKKLGEADIRGLKNSEGIYLLAPDDKVMSRRISESQRGLPLSHIAEEVLPFDASELFFAADASDEVIHTIVRSELSSQISVIETHDLGFLGVAFSSSTELILSEPLDEGPVAHRLNYQLGVPKAWAISVLLVFSALVAAAFFLSHRESQERQELSEKLAQLQLDASQSSENGLIAVQGDSLAAQIEIRGASQIRSTLKSVAKSLTETTQLDQLILSRDELVLDASASSATQVRANLDQSDEFESSEFVTSISRSNGDASERFRLKLKLKEGR